ncbi:hypothetical protein J2X31_002191 [Flavobacterium arsenatis]|uniref:Knr4/Smi1-like domain-containing protein n=1 Tax=Flavobacterium arsenatis TaxID=1484332 RepID=A0ABU1TQC1_9FLAO|nr:SMI1/KNR4 family protein [Flavobacterium arsenatis]MDR6968176.1 hypothetical protein [Flavobacterium arsenatis]
MRATEIQLIETELGITLPDYYKHFLLNYPFEKFIDLPNGGSNIPDEYLLSFAKRKRDNEYGIIDINLLIKGYSKEGNQGIKNKLCIGIYDADYYFIDIENANNQSVYWIQHEHSYYEYYDTDTNVWNWEKMKVANSIDEFIENLIEKHNRE